MKVLSCLGNLFVAVVVIALLLFGALVLLVEDHEEKRSLGKESMLDTLARDVAEVVVEVKGTSILLNARQTVVDLGNGLAYYKVEFNARDYSDESVLMIQIWDPVKETVFAESTERIGDLRDSPGSPGATMTVGPFSSSVGEAILADSGWVRLRMN